MSDTVKVYKVPVTWEEFGMLEVEANSLAEALEMVRQDKDIDGYEFALPYGGVYADGSFRISDGYSEEEIADLFNEGER